MSGRGEGYRVNIPQMALCCIEGVSHMTSRWSTMGQEMLQTIYSLYFEHTTEVTVPGGWIWRTPKKSVQHDPSNGAKQGTQEVHIAACIIYICINHKMMFHLQRSIKGNSTSSETHAVSAHCGLTMFLAPSSSGPYPRWPGRCQIPCEGPPGSVLLWANSGDLIFDK